MDDEDFYHLQNLLKSAAAETTKDVKIANKLISDEIKDLKKQISDLRNQLYQISKESHAGTAKQIERYVLIGFVGIWLILFIFYLSL